MTPLEEMERDGTKMAADRGPPAVRHRWSDEEDERVGANGYGGENNSPCPDITPTPRPVAVVPLEWAVISLDTCQR